MNKKAVNIMVFGIAVLMLLVRPYLVYQLTGYDGKDKNTVKATLLQRLIKKKDEHYEWHEKAVLETRGQKCNFRRPVKLLSNFTFKSLFLSNTPSVIFTWTKVNPLFFRVDNHRHIVLSCFRI